MTGTTWPRTTRASPQMRSLRIGLRLCGIARRALLALAERLLQLAHLGALPVPHLERDRLADRRDDARAPTPTRDAVADHDLRGDVGRRAARAPPRPAARRRVDVGVGADRAGDLARPRPPRAPRRSRSRERAMANAKSATRWPHTSGSAWMPCVRPTRSVSRCSSPRSRSAPTSASTCRAAGRSPRPAAARARCRAGPTRSSRSGPTPPPRAARCCRPTRTGTR